MAKKWNKEGGEPTITIRKATPDDAEDFVNLLNLLDPFILTCMYGIHTADPFGNLFCMKKNIWSYEHYFIAEVNGTVAALITGFDWKTKKQERMRTVLLVLRHIGIPYVLRIPYLFMNRSSLGHLERNEYYIGNIVVYPQFRRMYVARILTLKMEDEARKTGAKRMVLTTRASNQIAITLFQQIGYSIEGGVREMVIGKDKIEFYRLIKDIS